tara:strand:- start:2219 stop:2446 length:228 start_codon:yes stop_codon:yes gene_type:complete
MDKEKLKQELIKFAEWQEKTILPDTNEEMVNNYLEQYVVLPQADVIKSVCEHTTDDLVLKNDNRAECKCGAEWHY